MPITTTRATPPHLLTYAGRRLTAAAMLALFVGLPAAAQSTGAPPVLNPKGATMSSTDSVHFLDPETMPSPHGYTQVVVVPAGRRLVYTSGQVGAERDGVLVEGGFPAQAKQAFANVDAALKAAGTDFAHVIKLSMFVTDFDGQLEQLRSARDAYVNVKAPPASTTVQVPRLFLKGALVEIDAIAVAPAEAGGS